MLVDKPFSHGNKSTHVQNAQETKRTKMSISSGYKFLRRINENETGITKFTLSLENISSQWYSYRKKQCCILSSLYAGDSQL